MRPAVAAMHPMLGLVCTTSCGHGRRSDASRKCLKSPDDARWAERMCVDEFRGRRAAHRRHADPEPANAGIQKSFAEQIGAGRGDVMTPDSSALHHQRDPFRAIRRGRQLFQRKFTSRRASGRASGDGVGDIETTPAIGAGLADSCAGCHGRPRGSAGVRRRRRHAARQPRRAAPVRPRPEGDAGRRDHRRPARASAPGASPQARRYGGSRSTRPARVSKGIAYGTITALPDGTVDTSGVEGVDPDLRVRPFFAHGGTISIREFLVGAFNAEMGLEAVDPDLSPRRRRGDAW